jgi:hypothetical protein
MAIKYIKLMNINNFMISKKSRINNINCKGSFGYLFLILILKKKMLKCLFFTKFFYKHFEISLFQVYFTNLLS